MAGSPKKRAKRLAAAKADPLDERYVPERPDLKQIPWNKIALSDEGREAVARALAEGYPRNQIAKALGTTVKTLKRLIDEDPLLTDAIDVRHDADEAELRDILLAHARSGDTVAAIFLAKAQFGWRDRDDPRVKVESDGPQSVLVVPGTGPLDEWSLAAARQQAKYREAPAEVLDQLADREAEARLADRVRTGTNTLQGMRLRKPDSRELAN